MRESSQSVWMLVSVLRKTVSDVPDPSPESSLPPAAEPGDCCTHPVSARAAANVTAPAATKRCVLTAYLLVRRVPPGQRSPWRARNVPADRRWSAILHLDDTD